MNECCFIEKSIAFSIIGELFDDSIFVVVLVLLYMTNTAVCPIISCIKPFSEIENISSLFHTLGSKAHAHIMLYAHKDFCSILGVCQLFVETTKLN